MNDDLPETARRPFTSTPPWVREVRALQRLARLVVAADATRYERAGGILHILILTQRHPDERVRWAGERAIRWEAREEWPESEYL